MAGIIGAFLAGVALSEITDETLLHQQSQALSEFLTSFFLVTIGMKLGLTIFLSAKVVLLALMIVVLAVLSKLVGCGLGALGLGRRRALQVGLGMIPRGEVGIVVAQIGLSLTGNRLLCGMVVAMAVITTLAAAALIRLAFEGEVVTSEDDRHSRELQNKLG